MPLIILLIAITLIVTGFRGTSNDLYGLVKDDTKNFIVYLFLIFGVGAIGYFTALKPIANAFLFLIVIALVLGVAGNGLKFINGIDSFLNGAKSGQLTGDHGFA